MSDTAVPAVAAIAAIPGRMSRTAALWLNASIMVAYLAASTAPSPLYALYREAWGFSALTLTLVFSTYASRCWPPCSSPARCPTIAAAAR